jgi:hypothetical protein
MSNEWPKEDPGTMTWDQMLTSVDLQEILDRKALEQLKRSDPVYLEEEFESDLDGGMLVSKRTRELTRPSAMVTDTGDIQEIMNAVLEELGEQSQDDQKE